MRLWYNYRISEDFKRRGLVAIYVNTTDTTGYHSSAGTQYIQILKTQN